MVVAGTLLLLAAAADVRSQAERQPASEQERDSASIAIAAPAAEGFRELWRRSAESNTERIACIAGREGDGGYRIERVRILAEEGADSLHAAPRLSLELCGPPAWGGTAHTHIVPFRGGPFRTFSVNDRAVMAEWRRRWGTEGVFCVIYSALRAYCEYGTRVNGRLDYGSEPQP